MLLFVGFCVILAKVALYRVSVNIQKHVLDLPSSSPVAGIDERGVHLSQQN